MKLSSLRLLRCWFLVLAASLPAWSFAGAYDEFFTAVKADNADAIRALLQRGLDPNLIEEERNDTGLILALREGAMKVFDVLVDAPGIKIDAQAHNGDTAMMVAAFKGNAPAVAALLVRGAQVTRSGWTALHYAAASGSNEIVQMLLDKKADINARAPNNTTPIMMASYGGHIMTVKLLLDSGADPTLKNDLDMTAVDFAVKYGHKEIAEGLTYRLKKTGKL